MIHRLLKIDVKYKSTKQVLKYISLGFLKSYNYDRDRVLNYNNKIEKGELLFSTLCVYIWETSLTHNKFMREKNAQFIPIGYRVLWLHGTLFGIG